MKSKYRGRIIIIFILSLFPGILAKAQTASQDTTVLKPDKTVNIAYGKKASWMVPASISTVSGDELRKSFTPTNLGNTLFGRIPGLTVIQGGGEPGLQSPLLRTRGTSTFNSGSGMLIMVDGIESSYEQLVAEEIESVTVLKDASATAMYGSRGANGVMLVTTKRGQIGPLKVGFNYQLGLNSPERLPKFLNAQDYASLYNEGLANDGLPAKYTQTDLDAYKTGSDPYFHPDVNWYNQLLRKSVPMANYDLNFRGGSSVIRYFVLLNYVTSQGLYKKTGDLSSSNSINSTYRRINFRSNVDIDLNKNLTAEFTLGGSVEDKANPGGQNTSTIFNNMASIPANSFPVYDPGGAYGGNLLYSNPWADLLETGLYRSNTRVFQLKQKITEKLDFITPGLSISGLVAFYNSFSSLSTMSRQYKRFSISKDGSGNTVYTPIGQNTSLTASETESNQWRNFALQGFLTYNRTFGKTNIDAVMMANSSSYNVTGTLGGVGGIPSLDNGLYGRYTFSNNEKYVAEFSFGYNASEGFPKNERWGFFPSFSLGWIVSKESFLKDNNFVNYLKLRGSYGLTGNDNIAASRRYMWVTDFVSMSSYYFGTTNLAASALGEGMVADSSITWEKQKQMNFGFEATLYKHFDVTFDLFQQNRYDILASPYRSLPAIIGLSNISGLGTVYPQSNVGKVNNKGFEATIRYNSDNSTGLQYYIQAGVWYAKNKIVYNAEALQLYDYLYATGNPVGQPFTLQAIGFFKDAAEIAASPKQLFASTVLPGDIKYKDQNNDGVINQSDYYPIGNTALPNLTGSLQTGLKFKGFDLDLLFQGVTGVTIMESGNYFYAFQNNGNAPEMANGRWTAANAATATYPRLSASNNLNNFRPSSFWQKDGSFIKLRSIELGYSLPVNIISKIKLTNARVYLNGTNLFSLDHMKGFTDPETVTGYPAVKTFSVGIRLEM